MRSWLILGVLVAGCSPAMGAGFVPTVIVRGGIAQARAEARAAGRDDTSWRVSVDARWRLARPAARAADVSGPSVLELPATGSRCASERLCAWERGARQRAMRRIGRSR